MTEFKLYYRMLTCDGTVLVPCSVLEYDSKSKIFVISLDTDHKVLRVRSKDLQFPNFSEYGNL